LRVRLIKVPLLRGDGDDVVTGTDDVGLRERVVPGWSGRTVIRNPVVAARDGSLNIDRANGDGRRRVARRRDACIAGRACRRILAVVAGGGDDDDTSSRRALDSLHERIGCG